MMISFSDFAVVLLAVAIVGIFLFVLRKFIRHAQETETAEDKSSAVFILTINALIRTRDANPAAS